MKHLSSTLLLLVSVFIFAGKASAQTIIYADNFNSVADSTNSPGLPNGWICKTIDSAWSFDNQKPNKLDSISPRDEYNFMCDNKVIRLNTDVAVTFNRGFSATNFKNIKIIWSERISPKWITNSTLHIDYSIDSGKTWDSIPHAFDYAGTSTWQQTNGGVPVSIPSKANDAKKILLRWVANSTVASGNYQFDDIKVTGDKITAIEDKTNTETAMRIFPNPTTGEVSIIFPLQSMDNRVEVCDFSGKVIASYKAASNSNQSTFNLKNLPCGIYFVNVNSDGIITAKTVVKK
ncbi:MAG: T9SS type A sorting domain-containing protein [Bacteroidetes bacterium]|nr:T9SS type A sorting domain-containing protein [Bacteroidota bacterium]